MSESKERPISEELIGYIYTYRQFTGSNGPGAIPITLQEGYRLVDEFRPLIQIAVEEGEAVSQFAGIDLYVVEDAKERRSLVCKET